MKRPLLRFTTLFLMVFSFACTKHGSAPSSESATSSAPAVMNLAIWSNYVSPALLADFEKRTGIHVEVSNYSSNEELLAKLQAGASGYDVVVPSDYMVFAMIKLGLLHELDLAELPNSKSLDPKYLKKPYDPTNKYSVPYDWGTTGIAVNHTLYQGKIKGWKDLFDNPALAGKFSLLDDARETIGAVLKYLGFSLNSKNPAELEKAKQVLLRIRSRVKAFTSEPLMPLVNGETAVAHAYQPDALQARKATGGKIDYVIPEEGCTFSIDNLVIPSTAPHLKAAHQFINFMLEAKSNVSTVMSVFVAPANKDAFALLPKEYQDNPALFPPASALAKCEMMQDLGDALALWDRIWTEVKAQHD